MSKMSLGISNVEVKRAGPPKLDLNDSSAAKTKRGPEPPKAGLPMKNQLLIDMFRQASNSH